jgi:hypothetical protein
MSNECNNMTDRTLEAIGEHCPDIEELSIQMNDEIHAESFGRMTSLKTLVISNPFAMQGVAGASRKTASWRPSGNSKNSSASS